MSLFVILCDGHTDVVNEQYGTQVIGHEVVPDRRCRRQRGACGDNISQRAQRHAAGVFMGNRLASAVPRWIARHRRAAAGNPGRDARKCLPVRQVFARRADRRLAYVDRRPASGSLFRSPAMLGLEPAELYQ